MALEPIEAPPWAPKPQQQLETIDPPSWAPAPQRGVLQRAGEETAAAAKDLAEGVTTAVVPPSREEAQKHLGPAGVWRSFKETGSFLATPLKALGVIATPLESVAASGLARGVTRDPLTGKPIQPGSEAAYDVARPYVSAATAAIRPGQVPIGGAEGRAARALESGTTDVEAVKQKLETPREIVPGSQPTTFQVTGDQGLGQLERASANRIPGEFAQRRAEQNTARLEALEGAQPAGAPGDVVSHLREAQRVEQAQAEQMVKAAHQRAWEASQLPGGTYDPATYGNVFRHELERAQAAAKENEGNLYRAVDPNGVLQVNPQPIQEVERGIYGPHVMTQAGSASLTPAEKQISELISGYAPQGIPFKELRDLRSLTSSAMRAERDANGASPAYARLVQLRQGIEDALERSVTMPIPGGEVNVGDLAAQRLREASAATKQRKETFGPLEDVTRRETASGPYKMGESQVAGRIIQPGPKGYDSVSSYLRAVGNERGLSDVQDAIAASMRREVIGPDGVVNPKALNTWLKKYQDVLRAIDERDGGAFSQTLRNAGTAQEALEAAQAKQAEVAARYGGKDELGQLIGATDEAHITNIIGSFFDRVDGVPRARDLASKIAGSPAAQDGARRSVINFIRQKFIGTQQAGDNPLLNAGNFQKFVRRNDGVLRQLMTPEQVNTLHAIAEDMLRTSRSQQTKGIPAGSDTMQNINAELEQRGWKDSLLSLAIDMGVSSHFIGLPIPMVHAGKAGLSWLLNRLRTGKVKGAKGLLDRAMLEPEVARKLLKREPVEPRTPSKTGAVIEAGALSERKRQKEKRRLPRQAGGYVPIAGISGTRPGGASALAPARELRTRPSQAVSHARAPRFQAGGEVSRDPADVSRAQEPFIDPMSGAPATPESLRTIGRGVYNVLNAPNEFARHYTEASKSAVEGDPDTEIGRSNLDMLTQMVGGPKPTGAVGAGGGRLARKVVEEAPAAAALTKAERAAPREGAPFPQYAEEYPPIGPGTPTPKTNPKFEGETYLEKTLTPESAQFEKARTKVIAGMKKEGYTPYYNLEERFPADPSKYPGRNVDTLELVPSRADTVDKYMEQIGAPMTRAALRQAFKRGTELGNAHDWYFMGQLEADFIKELGPKAGREAFLQRFATPMAATTSGNQPTANLLTAHYLNYLRNRGLPLPSGAWETPPSVGGRFFMTNVRDYNKIMGGGGYQALGADQPKMHNFARSFAGDLSRAVMDEQMAEGMLAHAGKQSLADPARKVAYGFLERALHQEAKRAGVQPGAYQDVAWAGFKNEPGKPMMEHINDAIERTHQLTGMPREEIVRRGLVRGEIPLYARGPGVPMPGLQQEQQ